MSKYETKVYGAYNYDQEVRLSSSSGGVFFALAKYVIEQSGIVYGASFDDNWQVAHKSVSSLEDIYDLMNSKYVQSSVGNIYRRVLEDIKKEKIVLFSGTPCQVKGLLNFLNIYFGENNSWKKYMITMDFICHGVPSRMVWRKYLTTISNNRQISAINFRDKSEGWTNFFLKIDYSDGSEYYKSHTEDPYMLGFLENLYLRPSCHSCKIKGIERDSDITIGDFWGVQNIFPELYDEKGISVILAHNDKGEGILRSIEDKGEIYLTKISKDAIIKYNANAIKSEQEAKKRIVFFERKHYECLTKKRILLDLYGFSIKRTWVWGILSKTKKLILRTLKG